MGLKTPKNVILPRLDKIQDPEIKRVFQQLLKVIQKMNMTTRGDLTGLEEKDIEGTWTPVIAFGGASVGITYSVQSGLYTKIGRLVTVTGHIVLTSKGSSNGDAQIEGLPFTAKNVDGATTSPYIHINVVTFADVPEAYIYKNTDSIVLQEVTAAGVNTNLNDANFANTSRIIINATYFTD